MNANPILLQKKYARVIACFAVKMKISLDDALDFFYRSKVYQLVREGVSDMHCMSDEYLADELAEELLVYAEQEGIVEGSIFRTSKGTLPDRSNVWKEIKELCRTAGLEDAQINMQKFRMPLVVDYYPYYPMGNRQEHVMSAGV